MKDAGLHYLADAFRACDINGDNNLDFKELTLLLTMQGFQVDDIVKVGVLLCVMCSIGVFTTFVDSFTPIPLLAH